ncbi:hypothetical protein B0H13DRAFT_1861589 [Mycena leptocephala]|nr:hypothetical protein B0H13DRAFT_1861589 [Mycena leptocephala]
MSSPLDSTYGVWLISLFLETMLYGMGVLQTWIYFVGRPTDVASVKWTVLVVLTLETIQVVFFSRSSYFRFVERFGQIQIDLICCNSLLLYFASRIHKLTKGRGKFSLSAIGIYTIVYFCADCFRSSSFFPLGQLILAIVQILAGIAQTVVSYQLRSYLKLGETKSITTVQSAASLACDLLITIYLYLFLTSQKGEMMKMNFMIDMLIYDAINRGMLTALSSGINMVLFLALPDTFWFFLGLAPSSKLYMNSFLTSLNTRQRIRDNGASHDKGWMSILPIIAFGATGPSASCSRVDLGKTERFPACAQFGS